MLRKQNGRPIWSSHSLRLHPPPRTKLIPLGVAGLRCAHQLTQPIEHHRSCRSVRLRIALTWVAPQVSVSLEACSGVPFPVQLRMMFPAASQVTGRNWSEAGWTASAAISDALNAEE